MSKLSGKFLKDNKVIFKDKSKNIKVSKPEKPGDPVIVERIDKNRDLKIDFNNHKLKRHIIKDGKINFKLEDRS